MNVVGLSGFLLVLLVILFIFIGLWFRRLIVSSEDFLLAGRKAPFWLLAASYLGGYVGGASVSGYAGYGYTRGIATMWTSLFVVSGVTLFVVLFARRLNYFGRKTGAVTIADFVCHRYGEALRVPVALVAFLRPAFLTGMQFLAIAVVLKVAFGLPLQYGVVLSAIIILLYMITAGQYSALVTQWLQCILQSLGIILFTFAALKVIGNPGAAAQAFYDVLPPKFTHFWAVDFPTFSVWMLTLGVFYLIDPWIYMWAYIGESPRVSSNAQLAVLSASYYNVLPFLGGMALAAGMATGRLAVPSGMSPDSLYSWFAMNEVGIGLGSLLIVGLLMTIVSCGSSFAMNGVTILARDIYQKSLNKSANEKQMLFASRVSLVVVVVVGIASALWLPILVPLWVLAQALVTSGLFATTLSAWFWKRSTTAGAWTSTVLGGLVAVLWALTAWIKLGNPGALLYGLHAVHIGLIVSVPTMIVVSLLTKPEYEKANATHYGTLGKEMAESPLVKEKQTGTGLFGWLGVDRGFEKVLWIIGFALFALHYVLFLMFHVETMGHAMVWVSVATGFVMVFVLAFLGLRDVIHIVSLYKSGRANTQGLSVRQ